MASHDISEIARAYQAATTAQNKTSALVALRCIKASPLGLTLGKIYHGLACSVWVSTMRKQADERQPGFYVRLDDGLFGHIALGAFEPVNPARAHLFLPPYPAACAMPTPGNAPWFSVSPGGSMVIERKLKGGTYTHESEDSLLRRASGLEVELNVAEKTGNATIRDRVLAQRQDLKRAMAELLNRYTAHVPDRSRAPSPHRATA